MSKTNKKSRASGSTGLKVLCIILGVVLAILLAITVYAEYLLNQMHYVDPDSTQPSKSQAEIDAILNATEEADLEATGETMNADDVVLETVNVEIGEEDTIVNILLIGADYQDTDKPRSDTTMLVTFNTEKNSLTMTSFMRDLYIKIPGYGKNRLNSAYSLGGMNLLQETLNANFGVHVDGIVEVDFKQFEKIIDLLGGIELELTKQEAEWVSYKADSSLEPGLQLLTGEEAMWYSRNRTSDGGGDYNRTNRQRIVLNTLIETYKNASMYTILGIMDDVLPMITTNMTKEEITNYVIDLFPLLMEAEIVSQRIPIDDGHYMTKIDGMSVLVPDIEENVQFLLDTIGNDNDPEATESAE